jgi:hypothetical protein
MRFLTLAATASAMLCVAPGDWRAAYAGEADLALVGSCDVRKSLGFCYEYRGSGWMLKTARADCASAPDGRFAQAPCDRKGSTGTCTFRPGVSQDRVIAYVYYLPRFDVDSASQACVGDFEP